jgi:hypothetical protein
MSVISFFSLSAIIILTKQTSSLAKTIGEVFLFGTTYFITSLQAFLRQLTSTTAS